MFQLEMLEKSRFHLFKSQMNLKGYGSQWKRLASIVAAVMAASVQVETYPCQHYHSSAALNDLVGCQKGIRAFYFVDPTFLLPCYCLFVQGCVDLSVADGKDRVINVKVINADESPIVPSHVIIVIPVDHRVDLVVDHLVFHLGSCAE